MVLIRIFNVEFCYNLATILYSFLNRFVKHEYFRSALKCNEEESVILLMMAVEFKRRGLKLTESFSSNITKDDIRAASTEENETIILDFLVEF